MDADVVMARDRLGGFQEDDADDGVGRRELTGIKFALGELGGVGERKHGLGRLLLFGGSVRRMLLDAGGSRHNIRGRSVHGAGETSNGESEAAFHV